MCKIDTQHKFLYDTVRKYEFTFRVRYIHLERSDVLFVWFDNRLEKNATKFVCIFLLIWYRPQRSLQHIHLQ